MTKYSSIQFLYSEKNHDGSELLIEQLRYAGLLSVIRKTKGMEETNYVFRIYPPKGVNEAAWLTQNVQRMRSFGINAELVTGTIA